MSRKLKNLIGLTSPIRVLLAGFGPLSIALLRSLLNSPDAVTVVGLIPASNLNRYRFLKEHPSEIALIRMANERHVRILKAAGINSPQFKKEMAELRPHGPHVLLVGGWSEIIKPEILETSELTSINCHGSLLPKYRGACPYIATIFNGERRTGITFHLIDEGIDTGDILLQQEFDVDDGETALQLERRMAEKFGESVVSLLEGLKSGKICPKKQTGIPSYVPKHQPEWGWIPWDEDPKMIDCRMRALQGYLPLVTSLHGQLLGFESGRVIDVKQFPHKRSPAAPISIRIGKRMPHAGEVVTNLPAKIVVATCNPDYCVELKKPVLVPAGMKIPEIEPGDRLISVRCNGISKSA